MNLRRWFAVGCVVMMVLVSVPAVSADPGGGDAADSASTARPLAPGSYTASITMGDEDWYRFAVPVLTKVSVSIEPDCSDSVSRDFDVELVEDDGTSRIMDDPKGACVSETVHCWANANQLVYARVRAPSGDTGNYDLVVTQTPHPLTSPVVPDQWCTL